MLLLFGHCQGSTVSTIEKIVFIFGVFNLLNLCFYSLLMFHLLFRDENRLIIKKVADIQQLAFSAGTEFQRNSSKGD